jgi:2-polyprenyl-3-methyl-5-hydroxy-6-metoxy-1,4-benzoquinol methylase
MKERKNLPIDVITIACPICGDKEYGRLHCIADYIYGLEGLYCVVRCQACKHIYLNPRPTDASLMDCYPEEYAPYHANLEAEKTLPTPKPQETRRQASSAHWRTWFKRIPGLRRFLYWLGLDYATVLPHPPLPGQSRLLEIGCADGLFLQRAADYGWIVDGIEPNSTAAAQCLRRGFAVQNALFSDSQVEDASREAVMFWMVLEHVTDPLQLLIESRRILAPGGLLAFSIPNGGSFERHLFGKYWLGFEAPRHLQVFTSSQIRHILAELGYEQVQIVHQASLRYWWGSLAAWGKVHFPRQQWPARWMTYFLNDPPPAWQWLLLIPGKLLTFLHCSGRITVVARKKPC